MAAKQKPYGGVYENFDFEKVYGPKEYVEYPKSIPIDNRGHYAIANSALEEKEIRAKLQKDEDDAPAYIEPMVADPAKDILISRCRELAIPFNAKWSKNKLQQVVEAAEMDIDNLPAEVAEVKPTRHAEPTVIDNQPEENEDVHATLLAQAKRLGINERNMHLWGVVRLKAAIAESKVKN